MALQTQLVRQQHIVPRWHLRKFADRDGSLWCYKKNKPVKRSHPQGECWERDFYEYDVNGRRTENKYERWLAGIEDAAAPIHQSLINRQPLGQREEAHWALYVASLFLRTKKVRDQISSAMVRQFKEHTDSEDFIRDLQNDLLRTGQLVFAEDLRKMVEQLRTNMDSSPSYHHLTSLQTNTNLLARALTAKIWHVLEAGPGKFFVLSDCPVTTFELASGRAYGGTGFGSEVTTVLVPLTPNRLFMASPPTVHWKTVGPPAAIHGANQLTVRFGLERVFAHLQSPELKLFVDAEINRVTFGRDAFVPSGQPSANSGAACNSVQASTATVVNLASVGMWNL
jgi:hypothetical protein